MKRKNALLSAMIGVVVGAAGHSANAQSVANEQTKKTASSFALEEIIVTAQRREQNMQDVPVSVTAYSADFINKANIGAARDYLALSPGVAFTDDGQSGSKGVGIAIRGVGNLVTGENATVNSIGIYLDGFSIASVPNQVANPSLPDMQSIEVLRGPQGTYFGRNSVGGALNLRSQNPTDEFGWKLTLGSEFYEDANEMGNVTAVVNTPITDNFRVRSVLMYEDSGGRVDNICAAGKGPDSCPGAAENGFVPNGADNSGYEQFFGRVRAVFDFSDTTTISSTIIYADEDQGTDENVPSGILDVDTVDSFSISEAQDCGTGFYPENRNKLCHDLDEYTKNKSLIGIFEVATALNDNLNLTSIVGFIDAELSRQFDQDLVGGADTFKRNNFYEGSSWSAESRFDYSNSTFDWTLGALYSNDVQKQSNNAAVSTSPTHTINGVGWFPPFPEDLGLNKNRKRFEIEEVALFGDVTYHFSDTLDLILGGRFTHSEVSKRFAGFGVGPGPSSLNDPACADFFAGIAPPCASFFPSFENYARPVAEDEASYDDFAPRVGFRYQFSEEVNVYGMISKGYKPGGHSVGNNTNVDGDPAVTVEYDKEVLWNYELGVKSELFDNRVRLNASIYRSEWDDIQFESYFFLTEGDVASLFEQTVNLDEAVATGLELEMTAYVTENFTLSGSFGYMDTEITSPTQVQLSGGFTPQLQGLDLPKAPEMTASLVGEYSWMIGDNEAWVQLEYIHRDGQYSDIEGVANKQLNGPTPNSVASGGPLVYHFSGPNEFPYLSPDYDQFNLRAGYDVGAWEIVGYVQNLTDEEYYTGTQENFGVTGIRLRPNPRTLGLKVSYSFGGI